MTRSLMQLHQVLRSLQEGDPEQCRVVRLFQAKKLSREEAFCRLTKLTKEDMVFAEMGRNELYRFLAFISTDDYAAWARELMSKEKSHRQLEPEILSVVNDDEEYKRVCKTLGRECPAKEVRASALA